MRNLQGVLKEEAEGDCTVIVATVSVESKARGVDMIGFIITHKLYKIWDF